MHKFNAGYVLHLKQRPATRIHCVIIQKESNGNCHFCANIKSHTSTSVKVMFHYLARDWFGTGC